MELTRLARAINDRERTLEMLRERVEEGCNSMVTEAILQGQDLISAKARVPHGFWMDWLKAHCPKSQQTANHYMKMAGDPERIRDVKSISAALQVIYNQDEHAVPIDVESRRWPPYIDAISRFSKFACFVDKHPIDAWPDEGRDKIREVILPFAILLWPEKFNSVELAPA